MKKRLCLALLPFIASGAHAGILAQGPASDLPASWHAHSLWEALGHMLIFVAAGLAAAVLAYKVFDKCTPGDLHREILENKNVAAAILAGAVILGVCVIIAAAMIG